jgi:hypothetical protein
MLQNDARVHEIHGTILDVREILPRVHGEPSVGNPAVQLPCPVDHLRGDINAKAFLKRSAQRSSQAAHTTTEI